MITYEDKVFDSWEDVKNQYPMMWVVFDEVIMNHGQIVKGHVMAILPDEEIIAYRNSHFGQVKLSLRTSESVRITDENGNFVGYGSNVGGYIHGELVNA